MITAIDILKNIENLALNLVVQLGLWLVPLVPALFAQRAIVTHLETPAWWGVLAAIALEVVGIAAIKSLLRAYTWEQERRKSDPPAPMIWHIVIAITYFCTAFLIVLFLEIWPLAARLVPAAFVVLGGASAGLLALNDDQHRREQAVLALAEAKKEKKVSKKGRLTLVNPNQKTNQINQTVNGGNQPANHNNRLKGGNGHGLTVSDQTSNQNVNQNGQKQINQTNQINQLSNQNLVTDPVADLLAFYTANPDVTQQQAADYVGKSRPWVSQQLKQLAGQGIIERDGKHITLVRLADNLPEAK